MERVFTIHVENFITFVKAEEALNKVDSADKNFKTEFSEGFLTRT